MRISDWSSDVCSSDLGRQSPLGPPFPDGRDIVVAGGEGRGLYRAGQFRPYGWRQPAARTRHIALRYAGPRQVRLAPAKDTGHRCRKEKGQRRGGKRPCGWGGVGRKRVGEGKGVSGRVDLGGRGIINTKTETRRK